MSRHDDYHTWRDFQDILAEQEAKKPAPVIKPATRLKRTCEACGRECKGVKIPMTFGGPTPYAHLRYANEIDIEPSESECCYAVIREEIVEDKP